MVCRAMEVEVSEGNPRAKMPGYQRPYQRPKLWWTGGGGVGRHFGQLGRGFAGSYKQIDNRPTYGNQRPHTAPQRNMGADTHGRGAGQERDSQQIIGAAGSGQGITYLRDTRVVRI
jgi:hypothetical protein